MNKIIKQIIYIILLSILLGFIRYLFIDDYSILRKNQHSKIINADFDSNLQLLFLEAEEPEIINIDLAKKIYDNDLAVFIDARDNSDFIQGHIKNSINVPYELDGDYNDNLIDSLYSLGKPIVSYCSGEGCSLSADLSYYLYGLGFMSIFYFEEGYPVWEELDYAINKSNDLESNDNPIGLKLNFIDYIIFISMFLILVLQYFDRYKHHIVSISRFILGFIFIYFSYDKILDPKLFSDIVHNYDIVPFGLENLGALILPFIEFLIGLCLILGIFVDSSVIISIALLIFFILLIGQAYLRGKSIDCGCLLSDLSQTSSSEKRLYMLKRIVQDICFIVFAIIVKYRAKFDINND